MKKRALEILRNSVEWYYTYRFAKPYRKAEADECRHDMELIYDMLRELDLVTEEEYREIRHTARAEAKAEKEVSR